MNINKLKRIELIELVKLLQLNKIKKDSELLLVKHKLRACKELIKRSKQRTG